MHSADFNVPEYQELIQAANQYVVDRNFGKAQKCFLKAIQIHSTISLRNDYAIFLRNNGFLDEAIDQLKILHQESIWNQNLEHLTLICQNICSCLLDLGQHQEAEIYHQQAVCYSNCSSPSNLMQSAEFEMSKKNWKAAEVLLRSASTLCDSFLEEADVWGSQGALKLAKGEIRSSVPLFWKAYRIHRDFDAFEEAGIDMMNFSEISKRFGRVHSELRFLKRARHYFKKAGVQSRIDELTIQIRLLSHSIKLEKQIPEWN